MTLVQYRDPPEYESPRARAWIELMGPAVELAKAVAATEFVPKSFRNNPAPIAAAILYGDEVGLGPMQSLAKIAVIEGRPTLAAEAQRALILRAGHKLWLEESTVTRCTWAGRRTEDDVTSRVTWTMDDARRANLAGRPNWRSYPRQMLSARASAELAKAIFADVIGGLAASEEFEDGIPEDQIEVSGGVATVATATRRRRRTPAAAVATTSGGGEVSPGTELPPLPGEPGTPQMADAQRRTMMRLLREHGITTQSARHKYAARILGRPVTSSADFTADEAARVIGDLEATPTEPAPPPEPDPSPDDPPDQPPLPLDNE